jgi:type IV pilus assembly protein PilB
MSSSPFPSAVKALMLPSPAGADDAPAVRLLADALGQASELEASDIHVEPGEHGWRIRLRIDGVLHEAARPPAHLRDAFITRVKVLARLDIAERRVPQDGRLRLALAPGKVEDYRVSSLPTLFGEKLVLRRLDTLPADLSLDTLGFDAGQCALVEDAIRVPHGLVLVTGPTGSGKTLSLYCFLHMLNAESRNICSVEDPAEIQLPNINQVNVREKAGLTFAVALRAFLRQDPDVIMVGEIRDAETADVAFKAAQTGHLVLSTLHTNDAPGAIARLIDIGVAPGNRRLDALRGRRLQGLPQYRLPGARRRPSSDADIGLHARAHRRAGERGGHLAAGAGGRSSSAASSGTGPGARRHDEPRRSALGDGVGVMSTLAQPCAPSADGAIADRRFAWRGIELDGRQRRGTVVAPNPAAARATLRRRNIVVVALVERGKAAQPKATAREVTVFTRQLASLLRAGVPLAQALELISHAPGASGMPRIADALARGIGDGTRFAIALTHFPAQFDALYCQLVAVGESSGSLAAMLARLADERERAAAMRAKVRAALAYPAAVLLFAAAITAALLVWVVLAFRQVFESFGASLPRPTRVVLSLSDAVAHAAGPVLGLVATLYVGIARIVQQSHRARFAWHRLVLAAPIAGAVCAALAAARFYRALGTLLAAGTPLADALGSLTHVTHNAVFDRASVEIAPAVSGSRPQCGRPAAFLRRSCSPSPLRRSPAHSTQCSST